MNPFYRDNEKKVQWVGREDWTFTRQFAVEASVLYENRVEWVCEGIDTVATEFLNEAVVGRTENVSRPNILFLFTDQHRASSAGCYGRTDARTPNIDRLAESSVLFEQAYCQHPICTASRRSLFTGKYPGRPGVPGAAG